jgi:ribonuclease Z
LEITFLGTSAGVPTRSRNVSCVALRLPQRGEVWLFDCGEGTQHQLLRSNLKISQISKIFISHMHGDHLFGLPGLLATAGLAGGAKLIDVYGPQGLKEYLSSTTNYSETRFSYTLRVNTVKPGVVFEDGDFKVICDQLRHRISSFAFTSIEADRPGRFKLERAEELGIPKGPVYGELKQGKVVTLPDGRTLNGSEFTGPPIKGRRFTYCTDTIYCKSAVEIARGADLLVHEATFSNSDLDLAQQSLHSTTGMAARVAQEAGVQRLVITHISPRYAFGAEKSPEDLLEEARSVFPHTDLAHDFLTLEIGPRD